MRKLIVALTEFWGKVGIWGQDSNAIDTPVLLEDDGTLKTSLYATNASTLTAVKVESTGEQDMVLHGKDAGSNIDPLLTDTAKVLWVHPYQSEVNLVGVAVPSSEGVLLDGSASLVAAGVYRVEFLVVNIDGTNAVTVSVGRDDAAGGSLAGAEYWMVSEVVPAGGSSGWRGPFIMSGDDDVRGVAGAANDAVIHFRCVRVDIAA